MFMFTFYPRRINKNTVIQTLYVFEKKIVKKIIFHIFLIFFQNDILKNGKSRMVIYLTLIFFNYIRLTVWFFCIGANPCVFYS